MPLAVSTIWKSSFADVFERLEACIDKALVPEEGRERKIVFFRADDIAVPSENFSRLLSLFLKYRTPLSLATVPAWLTSLRFEQTMSIASADTTLWCWHQHGWRHANHSLEGKKFEFGQDRSWEEMEEELARGMHRMRNIMGEMFRPVFTPPWNRCGRKPMEILQKLGFQVVSRSQGRKTPAPEGLLELNVNVDLHTRKEKNPSEGWNNFFTELETGLVNGLCGIMIHHQLMNDAAFYFLEHLLRALADREGLHLIGLNDLATDPPVTEAECFG